MRFAYFEYFERWSDIFTATMPTTKKASSAKPVTTKSSSGRGKPLPPAAKKGDTSSVKRKAEAAAAVKARAGSALNVSVRINPLVDIVRQHVHNISPAAVQAIKREFVKAFQVTMPMRAEPIHRPQRAAAAEAADPVLSSQEAADLVGVSRPYMVARIDAGDVALHQQVGNQRRVLKSSVLAWQKKEQARRRRALRQLGASLDDEIFSD